MAAPPVDQSSAAARTQRAPRRSSDMSPGRPRRRVSCGSLMEACTATSVAGLRSGAARRSSNFSRLLRHGGCSRQAVSMQRHAALRALALLVVMAAASARAFGFTCELASQCDSFNPCDDDNPCTANDTCEQGSCTGDPFLMAGAPCDDDNPCTANDVCVAGICSGDPEPEGASCDDDNPCTADDTCRQGSCEGVPLSDGTKCNDDNPCTGNDMCLQGLCSGDPAVEDG